MMPLTLADIGEKNIIKHIGGSPEVKKHLENLGFVVGGEATLITSMAGNVIVNVKETRVAVSREMVAPLGDPVEVTVRNYELSIRKADAEMIEIEAE